MIYQPQIEQPDWSKFTTTVQYVLQYIHMMLHCDKKNYCVHYHTHSKGEAQVSSHSSLPLTKKPRYDVNKENCHQKLRQSLIKEYLMPEKN